MGDLWTAIILGIVEGITEFLPVSSTGHLIVAGHLLDFTGEKASCFEVFIQLGAILAVVCLYYNRFIALIPWRTQQSANPVGFAGFRGLMLLAVTTLPALVIGYFAHRAIKAYLFGPMTVAWALAIGGIGILLAEKYKPDSHLAGPGRSQLSTGLGGWPVSVSRHVARHVTVRLHYRRRTIQRPRSKNRGRVFLPCSGSGHDGSHCL